MAKSKSLGAQFQVYVGAVWTEVAQVDDIGDLSFIKEFVDCTSHDSPGEHREKVAVLRDTSPITVNGFYDPGDSTHTHLVAAATTIATETVRIVLPTTTAETWAFPGEVSNFTINGNVVDGLQKFSCEFTPTSAPSQNPA